MLLNICEERNQSLVGFEPMWNSICPFVSSIPVDRLVKGLISVLIILTRLTTCCDNTAQSFAHDLPDEALTLVERGIPL